MKSPVKWVGPGVLVFVALIAAGGAILLHAVMGAGGTGLEGKPSARPSSATAPLTETPGALSAADTARPREWKPPRFTARQKDREGMVRVIASYGLDDAPVLKAMAAVPRHEFVPASLSADAYDDTPLPIGYGQTISQPFIVAEMTRQLRLTRASRVLEIGTGSGYQAAVLTEFTPHVYSLEVVPPLAAAAEKRLKRLGYGVVRVRTGDGYHGWPQAAPFDGIIVTCATGQIPPPLISQLAPGGRMVIPVGPPYGIQYLMLVAKDGKGKVRSRSLMAVRFVPLVRRDTREE